MSNRLIQQPFDRNRLKGVIVAMNSCYDAEGNISLSAVRALTRYLLDRGVDGLYVGGSTGEGFLQNLDERKQVLEAVIEENAGQAAVIAQVGALSTRDSVELARHAAQAGADALSAVSPFYYHFNEESVGRHWKAIMDSAALPFIIYHIPSATGFSLTPSFLREMAQHPQVAGVKITTASTYELQQFKAIGGDDFLLFNGPDEQFLAGRVMGADAGIGGTYGAMPELFVTLERHYRAGRLEEARRLQFRINDIIAELLKLPIYAALKELIRLRGVDCGTPRAPLPGLTAAHEPAIKALYEQVMQAVAACEAKAAD